MSYSNVNWVTHAWNFTKITKYPCISLGFFFFWAISGWWVGMSLGSDILLFFSYFWNANWREYVETEFDGVRKRFFDNPSDLLRVWIGSHIIACGLTYPLETNAVFHFYFYFSDFLHFPDFSPTLAAHSVRWGPPVLFWVWSLERTWHSECLLLPATQGPVATQPCDSALQSPVMVFPKSTNNTFWSRSWSRPKTILGLQSNRSLQWHPEARAFLHTSSGWGKSDTPVNSFSKNVPDLWFLYPLDKFIISPFVKPAGKWGSHVDHLYFLTSCRISMLQNMGYLKGTSL